MQTSEPFEEVYVTNIRADPARCNLGRARRVTFDMLVGANRIRHGCVAVRGVWGPAGLYRSAADARAGERPNAPEMSTVLIGLYGLRQIMDSTYARARVQVTVVGMLDDCREWTDRRAEVLGYCHVRNDGPYIALAEMYLEP